ncbi:MAG: ArsR/SmtB family transcription factor [Haloferacaceae archaeon]
MSTDATLLPRRPAVDEPDRETLVLPIGASETADLCSALTSDTARTIVTVLTDEPMTASDVADRADTSLQNARYHLERLRDAGLVGVVDTWYSVKGNEMDVYASVHDRIVLVPRAEAGSSPEADRPDAAVGRQ